MPENTPAEESFRPGLGLRHSPRAAPRRRPNIRIAPPRSVTHREWIESICSRRDGRLGYLAGRGPAVWPDRENEIARLTFRVRQKLDEFPVELLRALFIRQVPDARKNNRLNVGEMLGQWLHG